MKAYIFKRIKRANGCWEWTRGRNGRGYGRAYCSTLGTIGAHRFSWMIFKGEIPPGLGVLHKCDNPPCVNPEHLFLGNQSDNMKDCSIKERMSFKKLSEADRKEIKKLRASGIFYKVIAKKFKVSIPAIYYAAKRDLK